MDSYDVDRPTLETEVLAFLAGLLEERLIRIELEA
jgi:hypothetical protein